MKKSLFITMMFVLPFVLMGNKGCEKKSYIEHPEVASEAECVECHDDGRTRETRPKGHDLSFERRHGQFIQRFGFKTDSYCYVCHNESQCTKCHQQEAPQDHTEFWRLKGHAIQVGLDRSRCFACHRGADFCERCHSQIRPIGHPSRGMVCTVCHTNWGRTR